MTNQYIIIQSAVVILIDHAMRPLFLSTTAADL